MTRRTVSLHNSHELPQPQTKTACQVDERPAHVDVGADVVGLDLDGAAEVLERLSEPRLRLEGVAHVVEQLRVARVHLKSGLE